MIPSNPYVYRLRISQPPVTLDSKSNLGRKSIVVGLFMGPGPVYIDFFATWRPDNVEITVRLKFWTLNFF